MPVQTANSVEDNNYFKQILKTLPNKPSRYSPDIFPLGYYLKRREPRLLYVMPVTMIYDGVKYLVKTKNLSANGLQVFMPLTDIKEGETVQISFDKFIKEQNTMVGGRDQFTPFTNMNYQIKAVQHSVEKSYISLIQEDIAEETIDFFNRFIKANRLRYRIDAYDCICASKAEYYEKLYTVNMLHVPMFIHWDRSNGFYIDAVIKTERNIDFFNFISHSSVPDFSPFCLPQRIEKFAKMAGSEQSAVLFLYWENNNLFSVFDFELQSLNEMSHIVFKVKTCKGKIFKAFTNLNKKPAAGKMTAMLSEIQKIDNQTSKDDKRASEAIAQIIFIDITKVFSRQPVFSQTMEFDSGKALDIAVFTNTQKVRMADGHLIETSNTSSLHQPDIVEFQLDHQRYDPRYEYQMSITVHYNGNVFNAQTIDFSRSGLGLVIEEPANIPEGAEIHITFSSLLVKGISTELSDIPHRVRMSKRKSDALFLGVIRNTKLCDKTVNSFFTNLVKRNKDKLKLCVKNKIDSVITTFYEAFVTENMHTIPIVISRDKENQNYIREIGLTETPCSLAEKLYSDVYGYDFRFLTSENRLADFHQRIIKASDKNLQTFMMFLFPYNDNKGAKAIFSITDYELISDSQVENVVHYTLRSNGSCVLVKFMNNLIIDKLFRTMTLDKVENLNKSSVKALDEEYKNILGFAEMIDLTDEYRKLYYPDN